MCPETTRVSDKAMAQTAGSSLRQRAGTYWKVGGTWRDSHVLCRTTELPVSLQFNATNFHPSPLLIPGLLGAHLGQAASQERPLVSRFPSAQLIAVHVAEGAVVRRLLPDAAPSREEPRPRPSTASICSRQPRTVPQLWRDPSLWAV